jgi:transposase
LNLLIFPNQLESDSRLAEVTAMPKPLSNDLRCRLVECVEAGSSRREAAACFRTAASSAVNVLKLWKETGSVEPRPRGGYRHGKLKQHCEFILAIVERQHDITMPELAAELLAAKGVKIDPSNLSKFLIAQGLSFKKNSAGIRARQA